jgi:RNA polymerase sigma-70 factor, ECF subfamily
MLLAQPAGMAPINVMASTRESFEQEALPHVGELYGAAVRLSRNPRDAEDLVQETYLRAFSAWDRFIPGSNVRAWLFRILTNSFINGHRDRARAARFGEERLRRACFSEERRLRAEDPETALVEARLGDEVQAALAALPAGFRAAVVLADLHDFSYHEIAEYLGIPVGTVMSRLHRGRRLLQARLAGYARACGLQLRGALTAA